MNPGTKAELKLRSLGIRDIKDIDIEAIAFDSAVFARRLVRCRETLFEVRLHPLLRFQTHMQSKH